MRRHLPRQNKNACQFKKSAQALVHCEIGLTNHKDRSPLAMGKRLVSVFMHTCFSFDIIFAYGLQEYWTSVKLNISS